MKFFFIMSLGLLANPGWAFQTSGPDQLRGDVTSALREIEDSSWQRRESVTTVVQSNNRSDNITIVVEIVFA